MIVYANVVVNAYLAGDDASSLVYRVPEALQPLEPGSLVWVPLGQRQVQGVVLELHFERPTGFLIRDIIERADPEAVIPAPQLALVCWFSRTHAVRLWDAIELALPPGVKQSIERTWRPTQAGQADNLAALAPRERAILYYLQQHGEQTESQLRVELRGTDSDLRKAYQTLHSEGLLAPGSSVTRPAAKPKLEWAAQPLVSDYKTAMQTLEQRRASRLMAVLQAIIDQSVDGEAVLLPQLRDVQASLAHLRSLAGDGYIALEQVEVRRDPLLGRLPPREYPPELTLEQERGWHAIVKAQDGARQSQKGQVLLLHGVTGSGKTELYLRAIGRVLRQGGQALVLVPEIALTTQLVRRFAARFPSQLAVLHSGLSTGERYDEWRRLRRGAAQVAIGSRSAIWAPLSKLQLIIVDEEHEPSFKHEATPFYHARDVAQHMCTLIGGVTLLGSATPALETAYAVHVGRIDLIELKERVGRKEVAGIIKADPIPLPPVRVIDMRVELKAGVRSIFSRPLQAALQRTVEAGQQTILFLNRRGLASFVLCRDCGSTVQCQRCAVALAVHGLEGKDTAYNTLRCHYCGHVEMVPRHCPTCFSTRIRDFGIGTQRVVEDVRELLPQARVMRWDRDVTGRKGSHEALLEMFTSHQADILVGTQMVAKGLDLPLVTLVGVITADTALNLPDFRAAERTFQLLAQVAGRAGRRSGGGEVIVQTYTPEHYAIQAAAAHDYHQFYREEVAFRRLTHYPPFSRLIRFVTQSTSQQTVERVAKELDDLLRSELDQRRIRDWAIIGPAPAFLPRLRDRYRWHILVRLPDPAALLEHLQVPSGWTVDVDPVSLL